MKTALSLLALLVAGCCCAGPSTVTLPATPEALAAVRALDGVKPDSFTGLGDVPIVDVHTHTFNARYLPLRGIILGKRDKYLGAELIPDDVADAIAELVAANATLTPIPGLPTAAFPRLVGVQMLHELPAASSTQPSRLALKHPAYTAIVKTLGVADPTATRRALTAIDAHVSTTRPALGGTQDLTLSTTEKAARASLGDAGDPGFLQVLQTRDGTEMEALYRRTYSDRVTLMVSHSMDLGPVYNENPRAGEFLDYVKEQIPRYKFFESEPGSRQVYFVAYNPFREIDGHDKPLDIVRKAIQNEGAFGVKVYPPSGYRPYGNKIPSPPAELLVPIAGIGSHAPREQWDRRYSGVSNDELNRRLQALLIECETNDWPVFVHCNTGEFEAQTGYGREMADPVFWRQYLESRSANGPCRLRLCLGHAGGGAFWFGAGEKNDFLWGRTIAEMCQKYPNVYCEVGILDEILDTERRAYFIDNLVNLFKLYPVLSKKIMYGTDWCMPSAISAKGEYLTRYQEAFLCEPLRPHYADFFCRNAAAYLNIQSRKDDQKLPEQVRARLTRLADAVAHLPP